MQLHVMNTTNNDSEPACLDYHQKVYSIAYAVRIHGYTFSALFFTLILVASYLTVKLALSRRNRRFLMTVECFVIAFASLRAIFMVTDPYRVGGILPALLNQIFEDVAVPCLTSAFVFVQWTFWDLTKLRPLRTRRYNVVFLIVTVHILFVLVLDVIIVYVEGACALLILCQSINLLWGLVLSVGFFVTIRSLVQLQRSHANTLRRETWPEVGLTEKPMQEAASVQTISMELKNHNNNNDAADPADPADPAEPSNGNLPDASRRTPGDSTNRNRPAVGSKLRRRQPAVHGRNPHPLRKVVIFGLATSVLGVLLFGIAIYGMIVFSSPYSAVSNIWGWFIYHTLQRSVELAFGSALAFLAWQRHMQRR